MSARRDVVTLSSPGDIVAAVPHVIGFVPSHSVVVVTTKGRRRRFDLTMRLDLPDPRDDGTVAEVLAAAATRQRPSGAFVVIYCDDSDDAAGLPRRRLVERLERALPVALLEGVLVREGRWWSYRCQDPRCCPRHGTPLDPVSPAAVSIAAAHAMHGHAVLPDRDAVVASVQRLQGATAAAMTTAVAAVAQQVTAMPQHRRFRQASVLLSELVERYRDPRAAVVEAEAAWLQLAWHDVSIRDAVLLRTDDDAELAVLQRVAADVARRSVPGLGAPAYSVLAWFAYSAGDGVVAREAVQQARRCDPQYSLAALLDDALDRQLRPERLRDIRGGARRDCSGRSAAP